MATKQSNAMLEPQQPQPPPQELPPEEPNSAAAEQNAQRFPILSLMGRKGNTEVRNGMCYIMYRSQMDPRWPFPQVIDETVIDRNRLESLNLQRLNPDVTERKEVKCLCARVINLKDDWYAHLWDGTIWCSNCARCFRCLKLCVTAARKLNSIDGLVLCNTCMLEYGRYRQPKMKLKVERLIKLMDDDEAQKSALGYERTKKAPPQSQTEPESEIDGGCCCNGGAKKGVPTQGPPTQEPQTPQLTAASAPPKNLNYASDAEWISHILESDESCKKIMNSSRNWNKTKTNSSNSWDNNCPVHSINNHNNSLKLDNILTVKQTNNNSRTEVNILLERKGANTEVLREPRFRNEGRRPLRKIFYPNPRPDNYGRPDYQFEAPPYLGVDRISGYQVCPECNMQAITDALVVPGIARVYHEKSFQCANCKRQLHRGYQVTGIQFESCNCPKNSMVWCTALKCRQARLAHHTEKKCTLEPFHPGGRPMRDVPGFEPRHDPYKEARKIDALHKRRLQLKKTKEERIRRQKVEAAEVAAKKQQKQMKSKKK